MATLMAFAGGKGGVGKTLVAANFASLLAASGQRTILVDLDWGGSNAHTVLGVLNTNAGVGHYLLNPSAQLADLVVPLPHTGLGFLPGDGLTVGAANVPFVRRQKLFRELASLEADTVVLDLGAGTHSNTVDAFLLSDVGFVVTVPEPTAILNAFGLIKTALYRVLASCVPAKSEARLQLHTFFSTRRQNAVGTGLDHLVGQLAQEKPALLSHFAAARAQLRPKIVVNQLRDQSDLILAGRLRHACELQLGQSVDFVGTIPWDDAVRTSVVHRQLLTTTHPNSPFSRALTTLANKMTLGSWDDCVELPSPNRD